MRQSPLPPRSAPLARNAPLRPVSPLRLVAASRAREAAPRAARRPARDTGPDRATRRIVLERDGWSCAGCGAPVGQPGTWWSMQHRVARRHRPDNTPVNLVSLCGSAVTGCHFIAEQRTAGYHERGLWLHSWEDPAEVPVMYATADGGMTRWLRPDGSLAAEPPGGDAA